jgi:hypothetical protein
MTIAFTNYTTFRAAVVEICERTGDTVFTNNVPAAIVLAEAWLNGEIGVREIDATINGVADSRRIDISALAIIQPVALFLARANQTEVELDPQADGTFPYSTASAVPTWWAIDNEFEAIDFDCPLLEAYPFRFRYRGRLALASQTTNWLLETRPDVYLAATIINAFNYNEDIPNFARWKGILAEAIPQIKHTISQNKRGTLTVDPMYRVSRHGAYNIALG